MTAANTELPPNKGIPPGAGAPFKALFQPENRALLIAVLVFLCIVVTAAAIVIGKYRSETRKGGAMVDVAPVKAQPAQAATGQESPNYRKAVEEYNTETLDQLREENPSAHPIPVIDKEQPKEPSIDEVLPGDTTASGKKLENITLIAKPRSKEEKADSNDGHSSNGSGNGTNMSEDGNGDPRVHDPEYMKDLVTAWSKMAEVSPQPLTVISQSQITPKKAEDGAESTGSTVTQTMANGQDIKKVVKQIVEAATLVYGISEIALNTDYMGPVWLSIPGGPLAGADLLGTMELAEDKVRLSLRKMRFNGKDYTINAIALDPATTYAAVASRVDRHILYRYGFWGFGTVLNAVGKAALAANQQIAVSEGVTVQGSKMDASDEVKVALGELGQDVGETFKERLNRPITVHVDAGQELGVFFLDSVVEEKR